MAKIVAIYPPRVPRFRLRWGFSMGGGFFSKEYFTLPEADAVAKRMFENGEPYIEIWDLEQD